MNLSRRSVLSAGGLALATTAGCLSEPGNADEPEGAYAAFFALADWTRQVAGDELSVENPVDVGEMGHGWEPPGDLRRDVASSRAFVYLDTPAFSWAQDLAADLDAETDVTLVDGMAGLDDYLRPLDGDGTDDDHGHDEGDDHDEEDDHEPERDDHVPEPDRGADVDLEASPIVRFDLYDRRSESRVAYWHGDHWDGGLPTVPLGDAVAVTAVVEDEAGHVLPLGDDERFRLDARVNDLAEDGIVAIESGGDHVELHGLEAGRTRVVFELVEDGEVVFDTDADPLPVDVEEGPAETVAPESYDPHVWVDPVIAREIVGTIADGLAEADPDNADAFAENAVAYDERLEAVDAQFEELVAAADREVAVFAGHDSFGYLEDRYGFELHTPVGVSPDAAETESDISETIDVVEDFGIDTILYDPFETAAPGEEYPRMVELLLENTGAESAAPLTSVEGTTAEWNERGWGWIELMEEVNLPSLRQALGAE